VGAGGVLVTGGAGGGRPRRQPRAGSPRESSRFRGTPGRVTQACQSPVLRSKVARVPRTLARMFSTGLERDQGLVGAVSWREA